MPASQTRDGDSYRISFCQAVPARNPHGGWALALWARGANIDNSLVAESAASSMLLASRFHDLFACVGVLDVLMCVIEGEETMQKHIEKALGVLAVLFIASFYVYVALLISF